MPVVVPFLSGAKKISIDLAESVVILRGNGSDKSTQMLQGEVNIVLTRPIQVSTVVIKFVGKSCSLWPEGIGSRKGKHYHEKILHKQELILKSYNNDTLDAGVHRWPFQFILSNSLVETIEDEMSKVFYYLSATVHRVAKGTTNPRCRRDLLLLRIPHWSNESIIANALPTPSIISDRRLPACDVHICIDKSSASSGTQFPISFKILPNIKHLFLESISVVMSEKKTYCLPEFQAKRVEYNDFKVSLLSVASLIDPSFPIPSSTVNHKDIKRLLHVKNAHLPLDKEPFLYRLHFTLPSCIYMNHSSTFADIRMQHTLKINIELSSPHEDPICVYFETPITVLDCRLKEDFHSLPSYEEAALSDPVHEEPKGCFVCPCYIEYRKNRNGSMKDWLASRHQQGAIHNVSDSVVPPPAYETINE